MKRKIRLNERQLNDMIGRVVERVIREDYDEEYEDEEDSYSRFNNEGFDLSEEAIDFIEKYEEMQGSYDAEEVFRNLSIPDKREATQALISIYKDNEVELFNLCEFYYNL